MRARSAGDFWFAMAERAFRDFVAGLAASDHHQPFTI